MIITIQFYSVFIPPPKLSPLETISFSRDAYFVSLEYNTDPLWSWCSLTICV